MLANVSLQRSGRSGCTQIKTKMLARTLITNCLSVELSPNIGSHPHGKFKISACQKRRRRCIDTTEVAAGQRNRWRVVHPSLSLARRTSPSRMSRPHRFEPRTTFEGGAPFVSQKGASVTSLRREGGDAGAAADGAQH